MFMHRTCAMHNFLSLFETMLKCFNFPNCFNFVSTVFPLCRGFWSPRAVLFLISAMGCFKKMGGVSAFPTASAVFQRFPHYVGDFRAPVQFFSWFLLWGVSRKWGVFQLSPHLAVFSTFPPKSFLFLAKTEEGVSTNPSTVPHGCFNKSGGAQDSVFFLAISRGGVSTFPPLSGFLMFL